MAKENLFLKNVRELGLIDDREIAYAAEIVCTNGNRGRGWLLLNGAVLNLYAMAGFADLGEHVETLDLKAARFIKGSSFLLNPYLKLEYAGHTYTIKNFAQPKKVIETLQGECGR